MADLPPEARAKIEALCLGEAPSAEAGGACQAMMTFYGEGLFGYPVDEARSRELFDRMKMHWANACKADDIPACSSLGLLNGIKLRSLPPDSDSAKEWAPATIPWLHRACVGRDATACDALAEIYETGRGVKASLVKANEARVLEAEAKKQKAP